MEIRKFVSELKDKYGYSDEMELFLQKAIPAMVLYYGEDKRDVILSALSECEIHIQKEDENIDDYLNQYFGTDRKWEIPFLGSAFQHTELTVDNNQFNQKNIIYLKTVYMHQYNEFDFNDDEKLSGLIHEICHAVKSYGKLKIEDGSVVTSSGLIKDYYDYDKEKNEFINTKTCNTGLEEALNSYDEASIMTIITGKFHEFGAYKGMTKVARKLMMHDDLAQAIRTSQFSGGNEWVEFLGKEDSEFLSKNFDDWVNVLYTPPAELMDNKEAIMEKMKTAMTNVDEFATNYSSENEMQPLMESRKIGR